MALVKRKRIERWLIDWKSALILGEMAWIKSIALHLFRNKIICRSSNNESQSSACRMWYSAVRRWRGGVSCHQCCCLYLTSALLCKYNSAQCFQKPISTALLLSLCRSCGVGEIQLPWDVMLLKVKDSVLEGWNFGTLSSMPPLS